jgi:hypothetical protein
MPKLSPRIRWNPELPHPIRSWLDRFECDWRFLSSNSRSLHQDPWSWLTEQQVMPSGALEAGWSYLLGHWEHSHQISQDLPMPRVHSGTAASIAKKGITEMPAIGSGGSRGQAF